VGDAREEIDERPNIALGREKLAMPAIVLALFHQE
jgi:hypothetical protein